MTIEEMKEAWIKQVPVILHIDLINPSEKFTGDYEYKRIIGYAKEMQSNGEIKYIVKLEDKGGYSISYADPKDLRVKEVKNVSRNKSNRDISTSAKSA